MPSVQFASQSYHRNDYGLPPEECVNLIPEPGAAAGTGEPFALIPREGRVQFADTGESECQGGFQRDGVAGGKLITVHNTKVYATDKFGVSTLIGATDFPLGPVRFAADRNTIVMIPPSGNPFRTDGTIVAAIDDEDLPTPVTDATALDQRIIYAVKDDDQFYWSEVLSAQNVVGLSFATAERRSDPLVGCIAAHDALYLFGTETGEVWQGTGGVSDEAFEPVPGAAIERGCAARDTIITADNTVFFLGDNGIFYRIGSGYTPERVSTFSVEEAASSEIEKGNAENIRCWTYTRGGHEQIGLRMPTEGTFVLDVSSGRWWEFRQFEQTASQQIFAVRAFNRILVGDENSGKIWELSPTTFTDDGTTIERVATCNVPVNQRTPNFAFRIHAVEGLGTQTGQGSNPKIMLDYSDDGEGRVWSNEKRLAIGQVGQYGKRVIARALGQMKPPGRIYRVRMTDPSSLSIRKADFNEVD